MRLLKGECRCWAMSDFFYGIRRRMVLQICSLKVQFTALCEYVLIALSILNRR